MTQIYENDDKVASELASKIALFTYFAQKIELPEIT